MFIAVSYSMRNRWNSTVFFNCESTNARRAITGFMAGTGFIILSEVLFGY